LSEKLFCGLALTTKTLNKTGSLKKMAYCHECGEEVAQIDVFCPHCGISLQPIAIPNETEESQESTIVINQSEIAGIPVKADSGITAVSPAKAEESSEPIVPTENSPEVVAEKTVEEIDMKTDDFSNPVTEENINAKTESVEIPADLIEPEEVVDENTSIQPEIEIPEVLQNEAEKSTDSESVDISALVNDNIDPTTPIEEIQSFSPTEDSEVMETSSETPTENVEPEITPPSMPSFTGEQNDYFADSYADTGDIEDELDGSLTDTAFDEFVPEKVPSIENKTESSMMSYQESEVKELNQVEEVEIPAEETVETVAEVSKSESVKEDSTIPTPKDFEKDISERTTLKTGEDESLVTFDDESGKSLEPSIAKPEFELEPEESTPGDSQFDSVRIMESRDDKVEDAPVEPKINNFPADLPEEKQADFTEPKPPVLQSKHEEEAKESRSYTTPNIGVTDTDGKKSKLKPLDEGTILNNRYEIVRKIGGGGMGAVYLASDKNLGGVLRAVKEMVQSYIEEAQQDKAVNDFKRESMLLTALEHPAIPTIFDYFYDEKEARFYLVMKYINGGDLSSRLRSAPEGKVDEISVVEWGMQVADVLDYLHKRQPPIVYRDLKPANIMIDGNSGKIMLIDFGIARWINKEEKGVTAVGTMGYAPPELFSGNVEARSDIYSLGSTMFHLLTGADPQSNPLLIFDFQKNPRPRQINPQLSDQIERILMRAVEYNAEKRFTSAGEMKQELEAHLQNLKSRQITFGVQESPKAVTLSDEKVFCGFCGQSIVASDLFCAFCGAQQPIAQKGVHGESYSSVPVAAKLVILGTNELESPQYPIEKDENLVGRRDPMSNIFPEVDLSKFDPQTKISRRHAKIRREGNKFLVEDLGSSNGTILMPVINEAFRLMPNQPHILTNGDKLKLGDTTLHFVIG
jgi:serine/threonine-protein kinase